MWLYNPIVHGFAPLIQVLHSGPTDPACSLCAGAAWQGQKGDNLIPLRLLFSVVNSLRLTTTPRDISSPDVLPSKCQLLLCPSPSGRTWSSTALNMV